MKKTVVIMAGGGGTRFWPLSRKSCPKQLIPLTSEQIMLNETIDHYRNVVPCEDTFIVTNREQAKLMEDLAYPELNRDHILREPMGRNTAPCILYSALVLKKKYNDCLMAVLPADHHIADIREYERVLSLAFDTARDSDKIVTIGLWPTYPSTGYGYIRFSEQTKDSGNKEVCRLERFVEKPERHLAEEYVRSNRYLWNSGMFIWKISVILEAFQKHLPKMYEQMMSIYEYLDTPDEENAVSRIYPELESVSIDYGIMEKISDVYVIPAEFGWNDVGSWDALREVFPVDEDDNVVRGEHIGIETENCVIHSADKRLIATIGIKDLIIVDTKDAILICHKDQAQDVKRMVEKLDKEGKSSVL